MNELFKMYLTDKKKPKKEKRLSFISGSMRLSPEMNRKTSDSIIIDYTGSQL